MLIFLVIGIIAIIGAVIVIGQSASNVGSGFRPARSPSPACSSSAGIVTIFVGFGWREIGPGRSASRHASARSRRAR